MKKIPVIFLILMMNLGTFTAFAEGTDEAIAALKEQIGANPIGDCHENLVPVFDLELAGFLDFLETNFQNKASNSSLTNIAISRYAEYKIRLQNHFLKLQPGLSASGDSNQFLRELNAYENCQTVLTEYLDLAKTKMMEHIKNTAAQKKTTIMVEKYKAINDKLRELNLIIARMYGHFMTFKDKLPGFLQNCVTS